MNCMYHACACQLQFDHQICASQSIDANVSGDTSDGRGVDIKCHHVCIDLNIVRIFTCAISARSQYFIRSLSAGGSDDFVQGSERDPMGHGLITRDKTDKNHIS